MFEVGEDVKTSYYKKKLGSSFNKTITKKDIFYGMLLSPFTILICINIVYLTRILTLFHFKGNEFIPLCVPLFLCICPALFYCYQSYKQRMVYLLKQDNKNNKFLSLLFITMLCLLFFITDGFFLVFLILVFNAIIFVLLYLHYTLNQHLFYNINIDENVFFNDINKIPLAILNPYNDTVYLTFLFDMKFFFHSQYIVFKGYKISYADITSLEFNFNKKLYDFNDEELKVVEMYAID